MYIKASATRKENHYLFYICLSPYHDECTWEMLWRRWTNLAAFALQEVNEGREVPSKTLSMHEDYAQTRVTSWSSKTRKVEVHLENYDKRVHALSISIVKIKPDKYHASPVLYFINCNIGCMKKVLALYKSIFDICFLEYKREKYKQFLMWARMFSKIF